MSKHKKSKIQQDREAFLAGLGVPEKETFVPDDFQKDAIEALLAERDTLVAAPTGAGKTYIATEAIQSVVGRGKRAVYTAPLKALSNAKYAEFKQRFEPDFTVGLLTGDRKIDGDADVVVATSEIYRNELYRYAENYALVVLDEFHYLADPHRGPVWEESVVLSPSSATLLMLSASISNPDEIAAWVRSIRNKEVTVIEVRERPVELRFGFLHPELGLMPLGVGKDSLYPAVADFYRHGGSKQNSDSYRRSNKRRRRK